MTTIENALAVPAKPDLTPFEGKAVRQVGVELPRAAGGLQESLKIDPQEFHQGEVVFLVLECPVSKVRFEPIDKEDPGGDQRRVHVFGVEGATVVDEEVVRSHLDAQARRIRIAKEKAQGVERLPIDDEDQLQAQHDNLEHREGLVAGCPACDEEADLEAAGE